MIYTRPGDRWDRYFLQIAREVARNSRCVRRSIGSVLVGDAHTIIGTGYNGPPRRSNLCHDRECIWPLEGRPLHNDLSGCPAVHSEANAVLAAALNGTSTLGTTLYCTCGVPCKSCLGILINAGVKMVCCLPETPGIGLYYDELSRVLVEDEDLLDVYVILDWEGQNA